LGGEGVTPKASLSEALKALSQDDPTDYGVWGNVESFLSGVRGRAPAEDGFSK